VRKLIGKRRDNGRLLRKTERLRGLSGTLKRNSGKDEKTKQRLSLGPIEERERKSSGEEIRIGGGEKNFGKLRGHV